MTRALALALLVSLTQSQAWAAKAPAAKKAAVPPAEAAPAGKAAPAAKQDAAPAAVSPSGAKPDTSADGGTSLEKADVSPVKAKTRFFEGMGSSDTERARLEDLTRALELYDSESREFRKEIQLLVEKKYDEKRNTLGNSYEAAIRTLEVEERKERLDAIAQFEEFLQRYPDEPRYSADVMFRLAELYYERSSDDHALASREYEEQLKKLDPEKNPTPPPEPKVDFGKSVALYRQLIGQYPNYKNNDASYYLLGYCLEKQEQFPEARASYQELIAKYPKSKFTTEAWVRIGEYYFDAVNEADSLPLAAEAYEKATEDKTHALFDKALYKLGWTYYRMDRFEDAVNRFIALVDYYDVKAKERGDEEAGGDLRAEAIQYTAISFVDEKWGSLAKAQEMFQKLGGRKFEPEIYRRMGDVYFDQTKHAEAVEAYRLVLQKDPLNKEAPQIQQRIVQAYERARELDKAFAESSKLADMFMAGTPWFEKWKRDPDIISGATELAEKSLYSTAVYHHQQALVYKKEGKFELAKATFESAAKAYGSYLQRFPRSKTAYEMEYYFAECLYNSFQFKDAAKHYIAVRDSSQDVRYQTDAAFSAVLSLQKQLEFDVKAKLAPELKVLKSNERPPGEKIVAVPFTETEKQLVAVSDAYLTRIKPDERSPGIAYKAAELFYVHNDFVEARRRFEDIVKTYSKSEVAKYATNLIIETYLIDKDWKQVEEVSARLASNKDVIDPKSELYTQLVKFKLAGRFKLAEELMAKGAYENAALKYIELVDEEPKHEFADKALNNAAVCYESARRFDSALKLYERIFREYPTSKLADAALFRVAVNAENSYDFDKAVESYQKLIKDYPQSKDRESALFNTARMLEGLQRYQEAAAAFLRYVDIYPKAEDAAKNQFRAALIYEKMGDYNQEIAALNEFNQKFSKDTAQNELIVDAKKRIADAYTKLGKEGEARKAYQAAADEFDKKGLKSETSPIAADAAAYSRFELAEYQFREFDKIKIGGSSKALAASFTNKRNVLKKVNDAYGEVFKYKRLEWTLAALYRRGYALERFAQTIIDTPVPPEVKRLGEDAVVTYQDALSQQTVVLEDKAVENYAATLAEAKKNRISNEWTKKTLESLNRFRPKDYPVLKEPKASMASNTGYVDGVMADAAGPQRATAAPQKLQGEDK